MLRRAGSGVEEESRTNFKESGKTADLCRNRVLVSITETLGLFQWHKYWTAEEGLEIPASVQSPAVDRSKDTGGSKAPAEGSFWVADVVDGASRTGNNFSLNSSLTNRQVGRRGIDNSAKAAEQVRRMNRLDKNFKIVVAGLALLPRGGA